jgi:hypothetical protein
VTSEKVRAAPGVRSDPAAGDYNPVRLFSEQAWSRAALESGRAIGRAAGFPARLYPPQGDFSGRPFLKTGKPVRPGETPEPRLRPEVAARGVPAVKCGLDDRKLWITRIRPVHRLDSPDHTLYGAR